MSPLEQLDQLAQSISPQTRFHQYLQIEKPILKAVEETPATERVRVALMSSFTIRPLNLLLTLEGAREDLILDVYFSEGRQSVQETIDPRSLFCKFDPEIVFYFLELNSFFPNSSNMELGDKENQIVIDKILELYHQFSINSKGLFIFSNFILPIDFPFSAFQNKKEKWFIRLNQDLNEKLLSFNNAYTFNLEELAQFFGKSRLSNPLLKYSSDILFDHVFMSFLSKKMLSVVKSVKSNPKKCIVLDCDNTLWGGVIGEVGLEGIDLSSQGQGSEFYTFQTQLKAISERGILLGINSKNNLNDVMEVLEKHPHMILKKEDFACIRCNWKNKSENMVSIAEELNIGLDSIVFIDDDPSQRKLIQDTLPSVKVLDLPKNPAHYPEFLQRNNDFESIKPTFEDLNRAKFYQAKKQRNDLATQNKSFTSFVQSLNTVLTIGSPRQKDIPRLSQLTLRTNQFNFTTKRYTEADITAMIQSSNSKIFYLKSKDIFGDDGTVGMAIINPKSEEIYVIDSFLLSCRVLGRFIEETFLRAIIKRLHEESVKIIQANFIPTTKNIQIPDFLSRIGFKLKTESGKERVYEMDLINVENHLFSGIQVIEDYSDE